MRTWTGWPPQEALVSPETTCAPGLRLAVHGRYNIYFRVTASETVIIRVVHSARDVRRLQLDDNDKP
jgi:plasmid stabilization system protein ParE